MQIHLIYNDDGKKKLKYSIMIGYSIYTYFNLQFQIYLDNYH